MNTTINVIRNRVDAAGVSGANVDSQGGNVVVQFPGVKNPQALIKLIGQTAQLYFRPVLCGAPAYVPPAKGKSPPSGPLPSCGQYATTAANLNVNTSTQQPANNIPADPAFAPYPSSTERRPQPDGAAPDRSFGRSPAVPALRPGQGVADRERHRLGIGGVRYQPEQWVVSSTLKAVTPWDNVASANFHEYIAIDLDGVVESAPLTQPARRRSRRSPARCRSAGTSPADGPEPGPRPQLRLSARAADHPDQRRCRPPWASRRSRPGCWPASADCCWS